MDIKKEDIEYFKDVKIRILTDTHFTYVGNILSYGEDYVKIRDKYDQIKFISFKSIAMLEEAYAH